MPVAVIGGDPGRDLLIPRDPRLADRRRTERITVLEAVNAFLEALGTVHRAGDSGVDTGELPAGDAPLAVVPAAP